MLPNEAWELIREGGIAAIAIAVIGYLFYIMMKMQRAERMEWREAHTQERKEWREDIKTDRDAANVVLKEMSTSIQSAVNNSNKT